MPRKATRLAIPDVILVAPVRHQDPRGFVSETYSRRDLRDNGITVDFVQDLSRPPGVVRGLHFQIEPAQQAKLVRVAQGAALMSPSTFAMARRPTASGSRPSSARRIGTSCSFPRDLHTASVLCRRIPRCSTKPPTTMRPSMIAASRGTIRTWPLNGRSPVKKLFSRPRMPASRGLQICPDILAFEL